LLTQETDRNGHIAGTSTYYPDGKLKSVTDAVNDNPTQYAYDTTTNLRIPRHENYHSELKKIIVPR
jgi:hypothetical protein